MKIINTSDGGVPNLDGRGRIIDEQRALCVLTQDAAGQYAAYLAIVRNDPARLSQDAIHVAHNGQKLSHRRALFFFPHLQEKEYRA